jgi:hypothetical protein
MQATAETEAQLDEAVLPKLQTFIGISSVTVTVIVGILNVIAHFPKPFWVALSVLVVGSNLTSFVLGWLTAIKKK